MKWMGTFLILLFLCQVAPHPHTAHPHAHAHADETPPTCGTHAAGHHDPFDGDVDPTHHAHDLTHHLVFKVRQPNLTPDSGRSMPVFLATDETVVAERVRIREGRPGPDVPTPRPGHAAPRAARAPPTWS